MRRPPAVTSLIIATLVAALLAVAFSPTVLAVGPHPRRPPGESRQEAPPPVRPRPPADRDDRPKGPPIPRPHHPDRDNDDADQDQDSLRPSATATSARAIATPTATTTATLTAPAAATPLPTAPARTDLAPPPASNPPATTDTPTASATPGAASSSQAFPTPVSSIRATLSANPTIAWTATPTPTATPTVPVVPMVVLTAYSDDFSVGGPSPGPKWTFLGSGGSTVSVNYQVPGKLHLAIDTSADRLCWTASLSCLRLLEPAPPGDFQADLQIDTLPPPGFSQVNAVGLLAYQDSLTYIRFEVQPTAAPWLYRITANAFIGGIGYPDLASCEDLEDLRAPLYLRVGVSHEVWTLAYSTDGLSYQSCGSFRQPLATVWLGPQVESDGTLGNFTHADFGSLRVAVPRRSPGPPTVTPAPVVNALGAEVALPTAATTDGGAAP